MQKPCVWFWICAGGSEQGGELMDFGLCYCAQKSKRLNFPQETVAKTTLLWGCLNCFPCSNDGRAETSISGPAVPWVSPLRFPFSRYCLSAPSEAVIMTKLPPYSMPFFFSLKSLIFHIILKTLPQVAHFSSCQVAFQPSWQQVSLEGSSFGLYHFEIYHSLELCVSHHQLPLTWASSGLNTKGCIHLP